MITLDWTDLFWFGMFVLVGLAILAWEKGWLGLTTEKRIKAKLAEIKHDEQVWLAKLFKKTEAGVIVVPPMAENVPLPTAATTEPAPVAVRSKEERLKENKALLDAGLIEQEDFDGAKKRILSS